MQSDTLEIDSSGTDCNTIQVDAGGKLIWAGSGVRRFQTLVTLTGDGEVHIAKAVVDTTPTGQFTSNVRLLSLDPGSDLKGDEGVVTGELSWTSGEVENFTSLKITGALTFKGSVLDSGVLLSGANMIITWWHEVAVG